MIQKEHMSDLADFMRNTMPEGKTSKLLPYADDIVALKKHGYSETQILQYLLEKKGLKVSRPTLSRFVRSHIKPDGGVSQSGFIKKEISSSENKKTISQETAKSEKQHTDNSGNSSFNWQQKIDAQEYI